MGFRCSGFGAGGSGALGFVRGLGMIRSLCRRLELVFLGVKGPRFPADQKKMPRSAVLSCCRNC